MATARRPISAPCASIVRGLYEIFEDPAWRFLRLSRSAWRINYEGCEFSVRTEADPFWPDREFKTRRGSSLYQPIASSRRNGHGSGNRCRPPNAKFEKDGYLYLDGTRLTSEILKRIINTTIMAQGYVPSHTIVASGEQCVDPHNQGSGPIRANTSIIMDIFPRSQKTGYFGDITRTVVRGRASERLKHAYDCVATRTGHRISPDPRRRKRLRHSHEIVNYFKTEGFPTGLHERPDARLLSRNGSRPRVWISMRLPSFGLRKQEHAADRQCRDRRARALLPRDGGSSLGRCCPRDENRLQEPGPNPQDS